VVVDDDAKKYRWLFIFDGIISLPIAIWGFWAIPDQPRDTKAWWLISEVCFI
jgi:ACS family pantothenate transporter-like MFS transporter